MSRSYKKNKVLKYAKFITKQESSKKIRRVNKIRVSVGLEPLLSKELINPYDINDCIYKAFTEEEKKHKCFNK